MLLKHPRPSMPVASRWLKMVSASGKVNRAVQDLGGDMCFKLDNGSELFSVQDMHRLRKKSSGVMGSRSWAHPVSRACEKEVLGDESGQNSGSAKELCHREEKD